MSSISHSTASARHAEAAHQTAAAAKAQSARHSEAHAKPAAQSKPAEHVGRRVDVKA